MKRHRLARWTRSILSPTLVTVGALVGTPALAVEYVVTTNIDRNEGVCAPADCSLREAILAANATDGPDEIVLPAGRYALTLTGRQEDAAATGDLDVLGDLSLSGSGATESIIDGMGADRVFDILAGTVTISRVTIQGGDAGGFPGGGGVQNRGSLTVRESIVRQNSAGDGDGLFRPRGGGILSVGGSLTVTDCTIDGNSVGGTGVGGGIVAAESTGLTLARSTLSHNTAEGALSFYGVGGGGALLVHLTTATITNCTFSGNSAGPRLGSVLLVADSHAFVANCTIADNAGSALYALGADILLSNTILADNDGGNCSDSGVESDGHNLSDDFSCEAALTSASDLHGLSAELGPLAPNGGPSQTHALLPESPAIDAGDPGVCEEEAVGGLDQRGYRRPGTSSTDCSIGAYEFDSLGPPEPTPSATSTPTSTRSSTQTPTSTATYVPTSTLTSTATPMSATPTSTATLSPVSGGGCDAREPRPGAVAVLAWLALLALLLRPRRRISRAKTPRRQGQNLILAPWRLGASNSLQLVYRACDPIFHQRLPEVEQKA